MRYLRSFTFPSEVLTRTTVYPYKPLHGKAGQTIIFDSVTLLYGSNGSGKSSFLNILATKLKMKGSEPPKVFGNYDFFAKYCGESYLSFETKDDGTLCQIPINNGYLKSEDVLYEVKKIQQEAILKEGYRYDKRLVGKPKTKGSSLRDTRQMEKNIDKIQFAQEKYSNGEATMQVFEDYIEPNGFYLIDEPEVSLSPENQLLLAKKITEASRYLGCQFIIATHSPLLLGSLEGVIYNFDEHELISTDWNTLPAVKIYRDFFHKH